MNHTLDQVRQSIVHVLDEWAKAGYTADERIRRTDWLSKIDRIGQDLHHAQDDYWSGPRHADDRRYTSAREFLPDLPPALLYAMQKTSDFRIGWARCWKWRNSLGLAGEMQMGFLHRPKTRHLRAMACWPVRLTRAPEALPPRFLSPGATLGGRVSFRLWASLICCTTVDDAMGDRGAAHYVWDQDTGLYWKVVRGAEADRRRPCRRGWLQPPDWVG